MPIAAQTVDGIPTTEKKSPIESAPTALNAFSVTSTDSDPLTADGRFGRKAKQQITISPQEQLEELALLLTNGGPEGHQRAGNLLDELFEGGYESLLAIHEFLIRDGEAQSRNPEEQELRLTLLALLLRFDSSEVEHFALDLLQSQPTPSEIWQLGRYLETIYPGKYTESIRSVASSALISEDPATEIPGGFFQLLGETGNAETAVLLANMPIHQEAYANFALASIPDGSGLFLLEQDALRFEQGQHSTRNRLVIELLASQAHRNTEAGEVLIELAERNLIPADTWPNVMAIVAGAWGLTLEPQVQGRLETHTIFRSEGDQVFYRIARPLSDEDPDIANQRLDLLERLQLLAPGFQGVSN